MVKCNDEKIRISRISGKIKRRMWIRINDIVLIHHGTFELYFSVLSPLVSVIIADIFCILGSVKVVASCVVPFVLFKINPFGNDDNFISVPFWRS